MKKEPLSSKPTIQEELLGLDSRLNGVFKESADKKVLVLQSHEDSTNNINGTQKDFLEGLGFSSSKNVTHFMERRKTLEELGIKMETIDILSKIKETYGKTIITYSGLVALCQKYNLYFGCSSKFLGEIPMENVKEMQNFNFSTFTSHYTVLTQNNRESIIEMITSHRAKTMIVAPLNQFNLKDVIVSYSREIIPFDKQEVSPKNSEAQDPIVLLPFAVSGIREVFFLVLTHWDNSNSII